VKLIVCDTGPLVHLFEANLLNLLEAAGEVLMPPSVAKELAGVAPTGSSPMTALRVWSPSKWRSKCMVRQVYFSGALRLGSSIFRKHKRRWTACANRRSGSPHAF